MSVSFELFRANAAYEYVTKKATLRVLLCPEIDCTDIFMGHVPLKLSGAAHGTMIY